MLGVVRMGREFAAAISAQCAQLPPGFRLRARQETFDELHCLILAAEEDEPHIAAQIIDEEEEQLVPAWCRGCHRPADVPVHQLELFLRAVLGFGREWQAPLLPGQAPIADLVDVVDQGQPAHHAAEDELLERAEVEVSKPRVPAPGRVISLCREADWPPDVELEDVEVIRPPHHLGEQAAPLVSDLEDSILAAPLELLLVMLPKADDVGGAARDVVDAL